MSEIGREILRRSETVGLYLRLFVRWIAVAAVTGTVCGAVGAAFWHSVALAGTWREAHPWLLWGLPAAGAAIVWIYRTTRTEGQGTNDVLDQIHRGRGISPWLLPAIFLCTFLTHLCGGSAGREGAALQMGGVIGYHAGRILRLDDADRRTATAAGMAAFFTALFGTPMTATVFALTVVSVGRLYPADMLPCLTASLASYWTAGLLGTEPEGFTVEIPSLAAGTMVRTAALGALCALVSVLFCEGIHTAEHVLKERIPSPWIRAAAGGAILIGLTLLSGTRDYNGAGMGMIAAAIEEGTARPEAFLLKLLFTALTLGAGFKGGEVVPSFFVGATFGAAAGPLLGLPAGFAASLGLTGVFCGATNCPLASVFLAAELFGGDGLLYYAAVCAVSFVLSGYSGLYSSQTILYSKFKAKYIDVQTNAHRLDEELDKKAE